MKLTRLLRNKFENRKSNKEIKNIFNEIDPRGGKPYKIVKIDTKYITGTKVYIKGYWNCSVDDDKDVDNKLLIEDLSLVIIKHFGKHNLKTK